MHKCTEQHHWRKHTPELCTGGRGPRTSLHHSSRQHGGRNTRGRAARGPLKQQPVHHTPDRGPPSGHRAGRATAAPHPVLAHANAPELCSICRGHTAAVPVSSSCHRRHTPLVAVLAGVQVTAALARRRRRLPPTRLCSSCALLELKAQFVKLAVIAKCQLYQQPGHLHGRCKRQLRRLPLAGPWAPEAVVRPRRRWGSCWWAPHSPAAAGSPQSCGCCPAG